MKSKLQQLRALKSACQGSKLGDEGNWGHWWKKVDIGDGVWNFVYLNLNYE